MEKKVTPKMTVKDCGGVVVGRVVSGTLLQFAFKGVQSWWPLNIWRRIW